MTKSRILLVGGDRAAAGELSDYLRHGHYEVEPVEYCDDALKMLQQRPLDLVLLLSLRAPWTVWSHPRSLPRLYGETGILFLKQLRALASPPPVIVLSATTDPEWIERAVAHAYAFLPMPCKLDELGRLVARALATSRIGGGLADENAVG